MNDELSTGRARIHRFRDSSQGEPLRIEVSPFMVALKMDITSIDATAGRLHAAFEPGAEYVGGARPTVHGGAIATMLDIAMATMAVALSAPDKAVATANLNVSYLRPLPAGRCSCDVEVERMGRTLGFMRGVLVDANGALVATATATFSVFTP